MSLSSTTTIKQQLSTLLGQKSSTYFATLSLFVSGKISRGEFEEALKPVLDAQNLIQLHNALIISIFDARSFKRPATPPPEAPRQSPRKRRRTLPYQGPDDYGSIRSERLKIWTISLGKQERDRIGHLPQLAVPTELARPRPEADEIARERGVALLPERGEPPGSRLAVQLAATTRSPNQQHIADRMNLICAQNNLGTPSRMASSLLHLACEVKLKQLITHALTLTSDSLAISSIATSSGGSHRSTKSKVLSTAAFETLFALAPADLPYQSAAAMRLAIGETEDNGGELSTTKDQGGSGAIAQVLALLSQRSAVKEVLASGVK